MRNKTIPLITLTTSFILYLLSLTFPNISFLANGITIPLIISLCILLLPALISKVLLKKKYFGIGYLIGTLIYPTIYLIAYLLSNQFGIDTVLIYRISSLTVVFTTMYLFLIDIYQSDIHQSKRISKTLVAILAIITLALGIRYQLNLDIDSGLSLDFLQHNAVSQQISEGNLCFTPNSCSSLFKKLGYTSFFHTIQTVLTIGNDINLNIAETSFNMAFLVVITFAIFSFFQKHFKDDETSFIAALIATTVFEIGAYSFNFLIPQTLTLLLFINILAERKLTWTKILLSTPLLLASHFIFGPFFITLLLIYNTFFNTNTDQKSRGLAKTLTLIMLIGVIITFIANLRGFSVEKIIQKSDIEQLGFFTNFYYPKNLTFLAKKYGPLILPFLISAIYQLFNKKGKNVALFAITYVSISLISYFLGPTYANKFLIGSSVFMVFTVVSSLNSLDFKRFLRIFLLFCLFVCMFPIYLLNFANYSTFYTQNNGKISSLVKEDKELITFLNEHNLHCQILSDPYTQLVIASQTAYNTAGGQYQELSTRKALLQLIEEPGEDNYELLLSSADVQEPFCILLSSRIFSKNMYTNQSNIPWLNSMYEYEINNNYNIPQIPDIIGFLKRKGFMTYYTDSNFRLFIPPGAE